MEKSSPDLILYWDVVHGHWRWVYTPVCLCVLLIVICILAWFFSPKEEALEDDHGLDAPSPKTKVRVFLEKHHRTARGLRSFAIGWWTTVVFSSMCIWIDTTWHNHKESPYALILFMCLPLTVAVLTFALEGLEAAYTELRDKDRQQFADGPAARVFNYVKDMGDESFFEAREWAIIALLVWSTLLIEQETYFLPFMGQVDASHKAAFTAVRITLTIALTAFALVWIAQSPGKYVARKNSVEFLSYSSLLPLRILRFAWRVLCALGLQYPSQIVDKIALEVMARCKDKRKLLPSDLSFFADGLKKYGYGFLITDDSLSVSHNGAMKAHSRTLHYVGNPRKNVKRRFDLEKGYIDDLKPGTYLSGHPKWLKVWAFLGPVIGENVNERSINLWGSVFYSDAPQEWKHEDYEGYPTAGFIPILEISPSLETSDPETVLAELTLEFGESLPHAGPLGKLGKALYVLLDITVETKEGAFPLPTTEVATMYPYFKKHFHPCLRSAFSIHLPTSKSSDLSDEFVFIHTDETANFEVTYDGIIHIPETERFVLQKRDPPFSSKLKAAPDRLLAPGLKRNFVCFMDFALPAAKYAVNLHVQRTRDLPAATAQKQAPAATAQKSTGDAAATSNAVGRAADVAVCDSAATGITIEA